MPTAFTHSLPLSARSRHAPNARRPRPFYALQQATRACIPRNETEKELQSALHPSAPKLNIKDADSAGRGLFIRDDAVVQPEEVIASIPTSNALVVECGESGHYPFERLQWVGREYWRDVEWDVRLCVLLLYHVVGGGDGYQGWLPRQVLTASSLPEAVLDEVSYAPLIDAVECYRYRIEREYGRLSRELGGRVTRRMFEWAMKIVHSRALAIPPGGFAGGWRKDGCGVEGKRFALVPVVDMINHGVGDSIVRVKFDDEGECFRVIAGPEGLQGGGQVLVSYGNLTNDDLYLWYGFVEAGNAQDVFEVEDLVDWVGEEREAKEWNLHHAKLALLERVDLCYEGRKFYLGREEIDPCLVAALRILLADAEEFKKARAWVKGSGKGGVEVHTTRREIPGEWFMPISDANEKRVWGKIERQCQRLLKEFPTSIELDEEMIILHAASSVLSDPVTANSLLFKVEKKRILKAAANFAAETGLRVEMNTDVFEQSEFTPPNIDLWTDIQ